jgi:POT family proton-dependent oligopeptide transporter
MQIYVAMVNTGGFIAPIVTGLLGQTWGWHFGFGFAGFGMLIGLATYIAGAKYVPADPPRAAVTKARPLTRDEWRTIFVLIGLIPVLTLYWIVNSQEWNVYNIWTRDHVDLNLGGWRRPVAWIQSLGSIDCVILVPPVLALWARWERAGRLVNGLSKMAFGCAVLAAFTFLDGAASWIFGAQAKIPLLWVVMDNFGESFGYLFVVPVAIAFFTRHAPKVNAMMIGVYYLSIFAGSLISGRLGGLYETLSPSAFWIVHAAIVAGAGAIFAVLSTSGVTRLLEPSEVGLVELTSMD